MGKNKLKRFAENTTFPHVFQPPFDELVNQGFEYRGRWHEFFKNQHTITLELGCGKGEYTVGLAKMHPERNYIGLDIKGARFWKGAKHAQDEALKNVAFVRTRIDQINYFFDTTDRVNEIWITFPDPQPRESKEKKRLTSPPFLERYRKFANPETIVHLKTDSVELFNYTLDVIQSQYLPIHMMSRDLYHDFPNDPILGIRTFYETMWLKQGKKIHYMQFSLK